MKIVELPSLTPSLPTTTLSIPLRNSLMYPQLDGGTEIAEGTIIAKALVVSSRGWAHTITFSSTDYNTGAWTAGTLKFADGSTIAINAGTTGDITATNYIYYDGTATLKTSTNALDSTGDTRILVCIMSPSSDLAGKCVISTIRADGTTISGNQITTGKVQSSDGRTYFDLDNKRIIVNDGTNDRILIGYQAGGF